MQELTARQAEVLDEIKTFIRRNGFPPTYRELVDLLGVHINAVYGYLQQLHRRGAIELFDNSSRAIRIIADDGECPMCGHKKKLAKAK